MTDSMPGVGVVGLGNMGQALARRLTGWSGGLSVYDVRPEATAPLVEAGARAAADVKQLASAARVISVVVLTDQQVRDVVAELVDAAAPGTVIAVHSTIDAETAPELAELGAAHGVDVLDVALTGGPHGAEADPAAILLADVDVADLVRGDEYLAAVLVGEDQNGLGRIGRGEGVVDCLLDFCRGLCDLQHDLAIDVLDADLELHCFLLCIG